MPKSKKGDTIEEVCPSVDHHQNGTNPLGSKSSPKKPRATPRSDKLRNSNNSGQDTSHDSSITLKPSEAKAAKTVSKSRRSRGSKDVGEECSDVDHGESSNTERNERKLKRTPVSPRVAPSHSPRAIKSDRSWILHANGSETNNHSGALELKEGKKFRPTSKPKKSQDSNKSEQQYLEHDHKQHWNGTKDMKKQCPSSKLSKSIDYKKNKDVCLDSEHETGKSSEHSNLKRFSKSRQSRDSEKTEDTCTDIDHKVLSSRVDSKNSKTPSASRRYRDIGGEEERCLDADHKATASIECSKKSKSSPKSRDSRHTNGLDGLCPDADHDVPTSPRESSKVKIHGKVKDVSESDDCHDADHDQSADSPKLSRLSKTEMQKSEGRKAGSFPTDDRRSFLDSKSKHKSKVKPKYRMVDKLKMSRRNADCVDDDHETPGDPKKKSTKPKDKRAKKEKQSQNTDPSHHDCEDTDHWVSSADAKKLKKLIKSREEKSKKSIEKIEKTIAKMEKSKQSKSLKTKGMKDCTCLHAHDLADCDVVETNDGTASRKASKTDPNTTSQHTPAQAFPRGLQIMANNTNTLEGGFPYPKALAPFGITKDDWVHFCSRLSKPLAGKGIPYAIDKVLDVCAEEDITFFRPRGFIMRLDMPGEEQYGLDIMDIYHSQLGSVHTDNFTTMPSNSKGDVGIIKHKHHVRERTKDKKHLETLRDKAFKSTRLMLDPVIVLKDPHLATQRGWAKWIIACNQAQKLAAEAPPKRIDNKPWYGYFPARLDRWPPSKHLYYERFRGTSFALGMKNNCICVIPDHDSMDRRGSPFTSPVVPCDEVEFAILR